MTKSLLSLAVAAAATLALPAQAQFAKPDDAVKYRQSAFALMGAHMGRIDGQLKSGSPDMKVIQSSAALVQTLSRLPFEAFTPGSDLVPSTKAKPEIWDNTAKFRQLADKMADEVAKLSTVAMGSDAKAIRAQLGAAGQACKACHDDYRMK